MPIYQRSIDTHGFQIATTASDHENVGLGNIALDISLMMGTESLGAGLMGRPGMFGALTGGKPLMGLIPGVSPGAGAKRALAGQLLDAHALGMLHSRAAASTPLLLGYTPGGAVSNVQHGYGAGGLVHQTKPLPSYSGRGSAVIDDAFATKAYGEKLGRMSERGLVSEHASNPALRTKANSAIATRMGIGIGLKALSTAWIFNDMFSLFVGGVSSSIQGLESFAYERRLQPQSAGADLGEGFADTRASFTQRQTAMAAIHNSQMNTRAAMGNEATFMHV